jgi:hypothetical protein
MIVLLAEARIQVWQRTHGFVWIPRQARLWRRLGRSPRAERTVRGEHPPEDLSLRRIFVSVSSTYASAPSWGQLVDIGFAELRTPGRFAWNMIAGAGMALLLRVFPDSGFGGFVCFLAVTALYLWTALLLARQFLTGYLVLDSSDIGGIARLFGAGAAVVCVAGILIAVAAMIISPTSLAGEIVAAAPGVVWILWAGSRLAFYLPALSVGYSTSLWGAIDQSKGFAGRILGLQATIGLLALAARWLALHIGLWTPLAAALGGAFSGLGAIVVTGALCHFYANWIEPDAVTSR